MHAVSAVTDTNATSSIDASAPCAPLDVNQLFREHYQHLLRFVRHYVRNAEDAEDVVQNTFLEAVRCASRFSGLSKPSTWLFGIALNLARNHVRRSCAEKCDAVDEAFIEQIVDEGMNPSELVELREMVRKAQALVDSMPAKIRATFDAVLDGESTYEEVAEHLNIPLGTVRSRVSRVRATVRAQLAC